MITAALAAWIPTLTFEALSARARGRAKLAIFDACGTALAGVHHPAVQHLRRLLVDLGSAPHVRIPGDTLRTSVLDATWLTGTMAEACLYSKGVRSAECGWRPRAPDYARAMVRSHTARGKPCHDR